MSAIRPPATPLPQIAQARAAFFRGAPPVAALARQPQPSVPAPAAQPAAARTLPDVAPERLLRPGSIIDIRV